MLRSGSLAVLAAALLGAAACERTTPTPTPPADSEVLVVTLARFPCFGTCPVYLVSAYADGAVEFEGLFAETVGHASGRVSMADLARLRDAVAQSGFAQLKGSYEDQSTTDCARAVLTAQVGATLKTVRHYRCDAAAPKALTALEDEVDRLLGTARWIGTRR